MKNLLIYLLLAISTLAQSTSIGVKKTDGSLFTGPLDSGIYPSVTQLADDNSSIASKNPISGIYLTSTNSTYAGLWFYCASCNENASDSVIDADIGGQWLKITASPQAITNIVENAETLKSLSGVAPSAPNTNYWSFGDSQTAGSNGAITNYTSGGTIMPQYRWVNLLAAEHGFNLTNLGKGGSSHAYNTGSDIGRQTPINRFGVNVPTSWKGLVTLMIGYNNIGTYNQMPAFDGFYQNAQEAFITRALLSGYTGVGSAGLNESGNAWASWSTTAGSQTLSGFTDDCVFPVGNPGTDQRTRLVITGTQMFSVTITNKPIAAVFFDAHASGGLMYVYTNGGFAGQIDSAFSAVDAASAASAFPGVLLLENLSGNTTITATNVSGTTYILAVGYLDSTKITTRAIIVGSPIRSYPVSEGFGQPYRAEGKMAARTERAVAKFRGYPVYYADVNGRMYPDQDNDVQDRNHLNIIGNQKIQQAFDAPINPWSIYDYLQAETVLANSFTAKAYNTNLYGISGVNSRLLQVGAFDFANTQEAAISIAGAGSVVAGLNFEKDGFGAAFRNWQIRMNSGASPLLRFVRYSGGSPAGVAIDLNYTDLSVTHNFALTNTGKATFQGDTLNTGSAPTDAINTTSGTATRAWQTNNVNAFTDQLITGGTIRREVVHNISGSANGVSRNIFRDGTQAFPLVVTNENNVFMLNPVTIGKTTAVARVTMRAANGFENRMIWSSGDSVQTNRFSLGLISHNVARAQMWDSTGSSALYSIFQSDSSTGTTTFGSTLNTFSGVVNLAGGLRHPPITKTTNYTVTPTDYFVNADTSSGSLTIATPAAATYPGMEFTIGRTSGLNTFTIDPNGAETIDGQTSMIVSAPYQYVRVWNDGSNWHTTGAPYGVVNGDAAMTGKPGEYIASAIDYNAALSLTNNTYTSITSIPLTAGIWRIVGRLSEGAQAVTQTGFLGGLTTNSTPTIALDGFEAYNGLQTTAATFTNSVTVINERLILTNLANVYLIAYPTFSAGTAKGFGALSGTRIR